MEKWDLEPRSVNRIESSPENPKRQETVTTKILELDINFVSLGSEGYSEDGRIQQRVCSTLSSTITWGMLTAALGIRNPRQRYPPS